MNTLNTFGQQFADTLKAALTQADKTAATLGHDQKVHVAGGGRTLSFAYEQLRNAAEYTEEHLLVQRAVRRFYKRLFLTRDPKLVEGSGEELLVELTLAGYLENDSIAVTTLEKINELAPKYFEAHVAYNKQTWAVDILAVEVERLINDDIRQTVFAQFAYDHFLQNLDPKVISDKKIADFELTLFIAVHQALLKSDMATIRAALLRRYQQDPTTSAYKHTNEMLDRLFESKITEKTFRTVSRRGAPFRILWRLIDEHEDLPTLLSSREQFLSAYEGQIASEYSQINRRINKGIIKSVVFLIITKFVVGVAVEVPYDYLVHGAIVWLVLGINLLFPPIYMILLRFTLSLPGQANTQALIDTIDTLLYGSEDAVTLRKKSTKKGFGMAFNIAYVIFFIVIFGGATLGLVQLGFSIVHLLIFFMFLSTASFLGFRLSRQIRDVEVIDGQQDGVTIIRDFLYMPFVAVGRWVSDKYARVNVIAMILDMVIELPLKTVLHLMRQWAAFISSKKDEL
jgi:hypothetical protein